MSNDTDFKLKFTCPSREQLEHVLWYINFKKERWDFWKQNNKNVKDLLSRVGAESRAAVVAWGFSMDDEIQVSPSGLATIRATAWANQNSSNVYISGDDGEIEDLRNRFSFLTIEGSYKDEYGNRGEV